MFERENERVYVNDVSVSVSVYACDCMRTCEPENWLPLTTVLANSLSPPPCLCLALADSLTGRLPPRRPRVRAATTAAAGGAPRRRRVRQAPARASALRALRSAATAARSAGNARSRRRKRRRTRQRRGTPKSSTSRRRKTASSAPSASPSMPIACPTIRSALRPTR